jgi:hypothetical protein
MIAALLVLAATAAAGAEAVKLFLEDDGSAGKVHGLTVKDMNLHPSDEFMYNENYFLIAITEAGYYGYVNLLVSNTGIKSFTPGLSFTIVTPDHKRLVRDVDFAPEDLVLRSDKFDLRLKGNYLRAVADGYELKIGDSGLGMELHYANRVPGFVLGNGKAVFGSGADWFYINYPGPRPAVTGKFVIEGREVPVKGWGYMDHSLSVTNPADFERVWHNMKFHADSHTVLVSSFTTPEKYEKSFGLAVITDDDKVLCAFTEVRVKEDDVKVDADSGKPYPGKVTYELVSDKCRARAVVDSSRPTEKFDVLAKLDNKWWGKAAKAAINTFIARPWYYRAVEPVTVEMTIDGATKTVQGQAFNEVIFTQ